MPTCQFCHEREASGTVQVSVRRPYICEECRREFDRAKKAGYTSAKAARKLMERVGVK